MLYDFTFILYLSISAIFTISFLIFAFVFIKKDDTKTIILKVFSLLVVAIHYSSIWVNYFSSGTATIDNTMILPIYPCNVIMWTLLITAFTKNKKSKFFKVIAEMTFYFGVIGGGIGLLFNANYDADSNLTNYVVLKGLLSHTFLILGSMYLLVGKFIKIRVSNVISCTIGFVILLLDGLFINGLFEYFNLPAVNSMYLLQIPFESLKWLNTITIGIIGLFIVTAVTMLYEQIFLPKKERWYYKLKMKNKDEEYERIFN